MLAGIAADIPPNPDARTGHRRSPQQRTSRPAREPRLLINAYRRRSTRPLQPSKRVLASPGPRTAPTYEHAYFIGLTYQQTAVALALPEGTAKARIRLRRGSPMSADMRCRSENCGSRGRFDNAPEFEEAAFDASASADQRRQHNRRRAVEGRSMADRCVTDVVAEVNNALCLPAQQWVDRMDVRAVRRVDGDGSDRADEFEGDDPVGRCWSVGDALNESARWHASIAGPSYCCRFYRAAMAAF